MTQASKARAAIAASKRFARATATSRLYRRYRVERRAEIKLIREVVAIQLGICPLCDDWLEFDPDFDPSHPLRPSFDHVVPRSKGGANVGNRIAMHRECNCLKSDRMPNGCELLWLAVVNARLGIAHG
jgi:5-methylcytosine-specific restriction endonuclease McrA